MSQAPKLAESAVNNFVKLTPSDADVDAVYEAVRRLAENPKMGTNVPFTSDDLKDIYVTWTPDGKWRILYRRTPSEIYVLSIERETRL